MGQRLATSSIVRNLVHSYFILPQTPIIINLLIQAINRNLTPYIKHPQLNHIINHQQKFTPNLPLIKSRLSRTLLIIEKKTRNRKKTMVLTRNQTTSTFKLKQYKALIFHLATVVATRMNQLLLSMLVR